jgi:flagellar protein FlbT
MDADDHPMPQPRTEGSGHLVIELRPGQRLLVNGAELLFRNRSSVVLCNRMRFLFGRQVIGQDETTTPARLLYYALQGAYAGPEEARAECVLMAQRLSEQQMAVRSAEGQALLREAMAELDAGRYRAALQLARRLFAEDDGAAESRAA